MTGAFSWARFVLSKVKVPWRAFDHESLSVWRIWTRRMSGSVLSDASVTFFWQSFAPISTYWWRLWHILPIWNINTPIPMRLARIEEQLRGWAWATLHSISVIRLALVLAYDAAFTLPALTATSLVLAYLAASTLPALTALSFVLTYTGIRTLQVGRKKAGVGAGQGAKI